MDDEKISLIDKILKNKLISIGIFILCISISIALIIAVYKGGIITFAPPKIEVYLPPHRLLRAIAPKIVHALVVIALKKCNLVIQLAVNSIYTRKC